MIKQHVCFDRRVPQKMLLPFSFPHLNATAKLKVLRRQHQHEELDCRVHRQVHGEFQVQNSLHEQPHSIWIKVGEIRLRQVRDPHIVVIQRKPPVAAAWRQMPSTRS